MMADNILYYGDNLEILRRYIKDESVDLVYLDPPFKSDQDYNILFAERNGSQAAAQIKAYEDTWHWDKISTAAYQEIVETGPPNSSNTYFFVYHWDGTHFPRRALVRQSLLVLLRG